MKKDSGRFDDYVFMMVSLMVTFVICIICLCNFEVLQQKININQLSRQYILRMETAGYLQPSDIAELTRKLNEIGVTEVSFTGTTLQQAGYGRDVVLEYKGNLHCKEISLQGLFSPKAADGIVPVHEKRVSTAKN